MVNIIRIDWYGMIFKTLLQSDHIRSARWASSILGRDFDKNV